MDENVITAGSLLLRALGNAKRLEILYTLRGGEMNVGELEKRVGLSQSALSQHLAVLKKADVVKTRREAQTIYYAVKNAAALNIMNMLDKFYSRF